jgi:dihydroxyacid dehydratase/phosphogluconate dehydratase
VRSSEWFQGNDETAVSHRVVMRSVGLEVPADNTKPIIGIADSSSDLNPCNLPLRARKISDIHGFAGKILLGAYNSQTGDTRN